MARSMAKVRPPNIVIKGTGEDEELLAEQYGFKPKRWTAGRGDTGM